MDVQGADKASPWIEKAGATYPSLVDRTNMLGERFQFNYVPLTILFDTNGRIVRGPKHTDITNSEQRQRLRSWVSGGTLDFEEKASERTADRQRFSDPQVRLRFNLASRLLSQGDKEAAVRQLSTALEQDPDNWIIHKQIWAIEHPERFYRGEVDFDWQERQLKEEHARRDSNTQPAD